MLDMLSTLDIETIIGVKTGTSETKHYMNVSVLIKFSQKTSVFTLIIKVLHKIIYFGCVLELPR